MNKIAKLSLSGFLLSGSILHAQDNLPLSQQVAATIMHQANDSARKANNKQPHWSYDDGVYLKGIEDVWKLTGDKKYFDYIQQSMDALVNDSGKIATYEQSSYNIDNVLNGRILLTLYRVLGKEKYYLAAKTLREQLATQPRTNEGGFWHKKRYPYQMWLDGLYMGEPFYAEWASVFKEDTDFNDIAHQFMWMEQHSRDSVTGLMYHGWDESKQEKWADKKTGLSQHFWGRAMGWYGMALVDALEYFPEEHPKRKELVAILNRFATAIQKVQDKNSGLWYDILNLPDRKGNYKEASASSMLVYAMAKGVRLGLLPQSFMAVANKGYAGIKKEFIEKGADGYTHLKGTVSVSGLGGTAPNYRDGSFEYYMSEKVITDDAKGVGAFIQAATEMEIAAIPKPGSGKKVVLDNYFNNETKKDAAGNNVHYHYTWNDRANSGFSLWGDIFGFYGAKVVMKTGMPSEKSLGGASVYIITDPDTDKETAKPNYVTQENADAIYEWVKAGGVLVLMQNDSGNAEFTHFNILLEKFGMHFNEVSLNRVQGHEYDQGAVDLTGNSIFPQAGKVYMKEISTLTVKAPAKAAFQRGSDVLMATAKIGKGTVYAVCDPWFYNEYTDGRKLPAEYHNYKAMHELAQWLLKQATVKK